MATETSCPVSRPGDELLRVEGEGGNVRLVADQDDGAPMLYVGSGVGLGVSLAREQARELFCALGSWLLNNSGGVAAERDV